MALAKKPATLNLIICINIVKCFCSFFFFFIFVPLVWSKHLYFSHVWWLPRQRETRIKIYAHSSHLAVYLTSLEEPWAPETVWSHWTVCVFILNTLVKYVLPYLLRQCASFLSIVLVQCGAHSDTNSAIKTFSNFNCFCVFQLLNWRLIKLVILTEASGLLHTNLLLTNRSSSSPWWDLFIISKNMLFFYSLAKLNTNVPGLQEATHWCTT